MNVQELVAELRRLVEQARAMPMSSSAVVNRSEVLELVGELEQMLPAAFADASKVHAGRDSVLQDAQGQAERIVEEAKLEREQLVSETDVHKLATRAAATMRTEAERDVAALRRETDEYVDQRLAGFEITLTKTLEAVQRGRERLLDRTDLSTADEEPFRFPGQD